MNVLLKLHKSDAEGTEADVLYNERLVGKILLNTGSVLHAERQRVHGRVVDNVTNDAGGKRQNQLSSQLYLTAAQTTSLV